jgi:hypothetical protein
LWIKDIGPPSDSHWREVEVAYVACEASIFLDLNKCTFAARGINLIRPAGHQKLEEICENLGIQFQGFQDSMK